MRLFVMHNGSAYAEVTSEADPVYVGSSDECAVCLRDMRVAPRSAVFYPDEQMNWVLEPAPAQEQQGVPTEVLLNGLPVHEATQLKDGDEIQVGEFFIHAQIEAPLTLDIAKLRPKTSVASMTRFVKFQLPGGSVTRKPEDVLTIQPAHAHRIGQVNLALATCETAEGFIDIALKTLFEVFGAHRAWVGVRRVNYGPMEYVEGRIAGGHATDLPTLGENLSPRALDRSQFVLIPRLSAEEPWSALAGPLLGPDGTLGMVYLDTAGSERRFDTADLDFFVLMTNLLGAQLDAIFKAIAKVRAATIDGEVSVVHAIQARLTPRKLPQWEGQLSFGAFREPGRERSSDCYDVVRAGNQFAAVLIAHTGASGPLPGMVMGQAQAAFRCAVMHLDTPQTFMRMLNASLYDGLDDHPLDCFMAVIDPASGAMHFSVAGTMGAYIIGARGDERKLVPDTPPPALGLAKNPAFPAGTEQLAPEESLALFTPGVITAHNSKGETFGEERFVNILCDGFGQLASAMLKEMLSDLKQFTEGGTQPDDITVILAHRG